MAMTTTEKILAKASNKKNVVPGDLIMAKLDLVLGNDITSPIAIKNMLNAGINTVFDTSKIALVLDHFTPNKDIKSAEQCKFVREFAKNQKIVNFFDVGKMGIEHALLPEQGLIAPGEVIIGADSHTCTYGAIGAFATGIGSTDMAAGMATGKCWFKVPSSIKINISGAFSSSYISGKDLILNIIGKLTVDGALYKALEFMGDGIRNLSIDDRLCIANMAIEAGAKNAIFPVDEVTLKYLENRVTREYEVFSPDEDAKFDSCINIDLSEISSTVAFPHSPDNVRIVKDIKEKISIDQVVIGSCTNGRIEDLRIAAKVLKGKKIADGVRTIIIPATNTIYLNAVHEGLIDIFINAGAVVSTPTCGPCLGGHMGILASGESAVATTNRNFVGRMGDVNSKVYLSSPAVAAMSAIKGYLSAEFED
ncbi:MAG: 3-isopropylmalate dehydratase large subunit [Clostridia bacterium]